MIYSKPFWWIFFSVCLLVLACGERGNIASIVVNGNGNITAIFTLGDSIVDPGNNNFIPTIAQANHPPYGQDFIDKTPTGRFCNGKLATDFVAEALGLKETLPAYLDPGLGTQDFLRGLSFASAGTGYDNLTANAFSVIPMWKQVEMFKEYKVRLEGMVGKENSSNIIEKALFLMVCGTNDFANNYFPLHVRRYELSVQQYQDFLLHISSDIIQDLYKHGAKKVGVSGLPPLGCLPLEKELNKMQLGRSGCVEEYNQIAVSYNTKLKKSIELLHARLPGIKLVYLDIYDILLDIITYPAKYGFESSSRGCCGTGSVEMALTCNLFTPITCEDASKFVFWDAVHPTQKTYQVLANVLLKDYINFL